MKILHIIIQICILYFFYIAGTLIHDLFHLPIPGSIIALILLFICLSLKIIPVTWIENGADFLLSILMLLFIPTTVGIMNYPSLLSKEGALFAFAILLSTIIAIVIAGRVGQFLEKIALKRKEKKTCNQHSQSA